jgi:hypothetical protein
MSEASATSRGASISRAGRAVVAIVALLLIWFVPTYIPFINRLLPNVFNMPVAEVHFAASEVQTSTSGQPELPTAKIKAACNHIPFLLRPIAGPPTDAKVYIDQGSAQLGWVLVKCASLAVEGSHQ